MSDKLAPWKKHATEEELRQVARLDEKIHLLVISIDLLKAKRKPILARCNLRAWRASRKEIANVGPVTDHIVGGD